MSGKIKKSLDEILNSENRCKINADLENINDDKFLKLNKRLTVVYFTCKKCNKQVWTSLEKALLHFNHICQGCNTKETLLEKYGVENISQLEKNRNNLKRCMKEKNLNGTMKAALKLKYGVENSFNIPKVREKNIESLKSDKHKQHIKEYNKNHPEVIESRREKMKEFFSNNKNSKIIKERNKKISESHKRKTKEEIKIISEKAKKSKIEKYGKNYLSIVSNKIKNSMIKKYGCHFCSTEEFKEYMKKYRIEHPEKFHQHGKHRFYYDNSFFDSKCELDFFIFCKQNNIPCERNESFYFNFNVEDKEYRYFPDFKIDKIFIEIKGDQFLKNDGTWQNIYDHSKDNIYEAKHQCAIKNNVKIVYFTELENFKKELLINYKNL